MPEILYSFTDKSYYGFTEFLLDEEKIIFSSKKSLIEIISEKAIISLLVINLLSGYILYTRIPFNVFIICLSLPLFFLFYNLLERIIKVNLIIDYKNDYYLKNNFFTEIFNNSPNSLVQLNKVVLVRYKGDLEERAFFTYQIKIIGRNRKEIFFSSRIPEAEPASKIATYISELAKLPLEFEYIGD